MPTFVDEMTSPHTLQVDLGYCTRTGPRPHNEDFCGAVTPPLAELENKGLLAVVADGVGGHANGREAAEFTVRGLLADYYATPDTWSVAQALEVVLAAQNRWLFAQSQRLRQSVGMATTLSALVLRGARYCVAHVGDSRIYRWRDGSLERLTTDHVWEHPELDSVLSRAVGLDSTLAVDFGEGELQAGDIFLLLTDGVWAHLGERRIAAILAAGRAMQETATELAEGAVAGGSRDNCTALALAVRAVPPSGLRDALARVRDLPLPPRLKPGQEIDGLAVDAVLHESRVTLLYRVRSTATGLDGVLKTLRPDADAADCAALAHEEWLARRVADGALPQVLPWPARAHLYYLMSWHEGATLGAWLRQGRRFAPAAAAELGMRLLQGVAALHRLSIIHRDIKPDNLHLGSDGRLRILDLGVAAADGQDFAEINNPGTPSYMAPELFAGGGASESSDLYACGVSLYELLTRQFPYGEIEAFQHPRFGEPLPPTRYRPDVPAWLEAVLLKAVARDPRERFETAEEFLLALERGARQPLRVPRRQPLLQRDPALALKLLAAVSLVANLLLLWLLLAR